MLITYIHILARELNNCKRSKTQNNNNMNITLKKAGTALLGLSMLLTVTGPPLLMAGTGHEGDKGNSKAGGVPDKEIALLLETYQLDKVRISAYKTVKIFDSNDNLIFSEQVAISRLDNDARLSGLIDKSDFLTEVDDVKYYKMDY